MRKSELHVHIKGGKVEIHVSGALSHTLIDIGSMLQQIYRAIPDPKARELFRRGVAALASDPSSPVWKSGAPDGVVEATTIDLKELARQLRGEVDA